MADLSCFATKKNADEGKWFPVKIKGVKFPLALLLYGSDSDVVQEYERQRIRKVGISGIAKNNIDEEALEELLESSAEGFVIRVGGVSTYDWKKKENTNEPVILFNKEIKNDKTSIAFLLENIPDIKDFISEKSNERANFLD